MSKHQHPVWCSHLSGFQNHLRAFLNHRRLGHTPSSSDSRGDRITWFLILWLIMCFSNKLPGEHWYSGLSTTLWITTRSTAMAWPGSLLEIHNLGLYPRSSETDLVFQKDSHGTYACSCLKSTTVSHWFSILAAYKSWQFTKYRYLGVSPTHLQRIWFDGSVVRPRQQYI